MSRALYTDTSAPSFDALNPYPWFAWMRRNAPVYQDPATQLWYVFGYHDVLRIINPPLKPTEEDPLLFTSRVMEGTERYWAQDSLVFTDPPRQRAVRSVLNPAFSPKVVQEHYAPPIAALINKLLDQVIDDEQMDVVAHLTYSLTLPTISEVLRIPQKDRDAFEHWTIQSLGLEEDSRSFYSFVPAMEQYFTRTLEERRHQGNEDAPDPISRLVYGCPADGVALTQGERLGNCEALPIVGTEATSNLITNLFRVLDAFPDVQQQVWENPDLVPALIEETLRYFSPLHLIPYRALQPVELGGKVIPENQIILALLSSGNRDEEVFEDSDSFNLMRFATAPPNHMAFGFRGAHFCLGAPLARLETTLLMQQIIARMENIRIVPGASLKPLHVPIGMIPMYSGLQSLPVTFQRRVSS